MNAVIGMSRMLMESDLPPDLYDCAETIESSGNYFGNAQRIEINDEIRESFDGVDR